MKIVNPFKAVTKPEYLFRPRQILTRLKRALVKPEGDFDRVRLPWGSALRIRPMEVIGATIWYYGIFDLIVAEAITRLLDPGETGLDVGANIGQMTSLMSRLAGPQGKVCAFEPHPEIFGELTVNVGPESHPNVRLFPLGLSDRSGEAFLTLGPAWDGNRGVAKVARDTDSQTGQVRIQLTTLDEVLADNTSVGVCKIDVEEHEVQVLTGAARLLKSGRIRDIIFEDFEPYPSRTYQLLTASGFRIFVLWTKLWRPVLTPVEQLKVVPTARDGSNFLATRDPARALSRFQAMGWQVLQSP
jgi:FkbM family methyltransferase